MNEPATKEDVEALRKEMNLRFDQNAQEHGSIINTTRDQNDATRAHIGTEVATVRNQMGFTRTYMEKLIKAFKRFLERMGISADDL